MEILQPDQMTVDILELNRLRRALLIGSHVWDHRFLSLDSLLKRNSLSRFSHRDLSFSQPLELKSDSSRKDDSFDQGHEGNVSESLKLPESAENDILKDHREPNVSSCEPSVPEDCKPISSHLNGQEETQADGETAKNKTLFENVPSPETTLSERIDSSWTGTDQLPVKAQPSADGVQSGPIRQASQSDSLPFRRLAMPSRVHSFDSALRVRERSRKGLLPSSLHVSTLRSFHATGDYRDMIRDPVSSVMRTYSQVLPQEAQKLNLILSSTPSFVSSAAHLTEGVRMLLPQTGKSDIVVAVYDNEPTSIISYALSSKEYDDWVGDKLSEQEVSWSESNKEDSVASTFSAWQSFGSMDLDYIRFGSGTEDVPSSMSSLFTDTKKSPHLRLSFGDDKVKFSVTCYYTELFESLRKKCCPSEVDFVRSLSRCKRWKAQGGKSNVYFAKSLDDRFIVKQVTKTELESFEEFAPEYFKYLTESLNSRSPTCLAKILGLYQVRPCFFCY